MTTFHAINTAIPLPGPSSSFSPTTRELTPTTPRADRSFSSQADDRDDSLLHTHVDEASLKTPTRDSFTGLAGQLPLPSSSSFPPLPHHDRNGSFRQADRGNAEGSAILPTTTTVATVTATATTVPSSKPASAISTISIPRAEARSGALKRGDSHQSALSASSQQDVEMGDGDDDNQDVGSDNDSDNADSRRPSKKKKGQRFFCTDFPPCQLSFTRSEHLARHIRKHTGERPFQCHCSRRFSRLDNLRQHAQTVHVNEDIPGDSLAATGTRFQRQIRTDRVRPSSSRSRTSTLGGGSISHGHSHSHSHSHSHGHGHAHSHSHSHRRNTSSSSVDSTTSAFVPSDSASRRRRPPPPLAIAADSPARQRLSMESFGSHNASPAGHYGPHAAVVAAGGNYGASSPTRFGTPSSATFSTETGSPRPSSGMQSPMTSARQQSSSFAWASGAAGRRLSVPSAANPFQPPPPGTNGHPAPFVSPLASSTASAFSTNTSAFASPTSSIFSESRNDSVSAAEAEWRRRTWHSGTYAGQRPATSGVSQYQRLGSPRPAFAPLRGSQAEQVTRLPGIESFDQIPPQVSSSAMNRRAPSPLRPEGMQQASGHTHSHSVAVPSASQYSQTHRIHHAHHPPRSTEHPNLSAWLMPLLHRGFNRLDIANNNGNNAASSSNNHAAAAAATTITSATTAAITTPAAPAAVHGDSPYRHQHSHSYTPGMFSASQQHFSAQPGMYHLSSSASNTPPIHFGSLAQRHTHQETSQSTSVPSDPPVTPRKIKRLGWYNGPLATSSPGSSNGINFAPVQHGFADLQMQMEQQQQQQQQQSSQQQIQQRQQYQHQQTSPEDSTSSSDGIPTPSSHSMMETDPVVMHSNGSVEEPQSFSGPTGFQREEPKAAASIGPPNYGPADTTAATAGYVRNEEARFSAFSSNGIAQGQGGHPQPHPNEGGFGGAGGGDRSGSNAPTSTPSFDLGFGPGPVEYSTASSQGGGADGDDTRRLEALVAVATREESDEMRL